MRFKTKDFEIQRIVKYLIHCYDDVVPNENYLPAITKYYIHAIFAARCASVTLDQGGQRETVASMESLSGPNDRRRVRVAFTENPRETG